MARFSAVFGINLSQAQLDFVDVDTAEDKQLFLDPFAFAKSQDPWLSECHNTIIGFFEAVLRAIAAGDHVAGRALLDNLHEPNETCLGMSRGRPAGRGVGDEQADALYDRIRNSRAAQTGLLEELSDFELFIPGVGPDKISDITTNIIRAKLIEYTQQQCELHRVPLVGDVASGMLWDEAEERWHNRYTRLPVIDGRKIILVPKAAVRWNLTFSHQEYYNTFVLEFLQSEALDQNSALVETLKNGRRRVTKKSLKGVFPLEKEFLAEFTEQNPEVLARYKRLMGVSNGIGIEELEEGFDEAVFAEVLIERLGEIPPGSADATRFHHFMIGVLGFVLYPEAIHPIKEDEIHDGRKRIDITYTNNSIGGFFRRRRMDQRTACERIIVEVKNYQKEMANPELDQIAGRFGPNRGRFGFLIGRSFDDRQRFIARCRDTARDQRGFILALVDEDIREMLGMIARRERNQIDVFLDRRFNELLG